MKASVPLVTAAAGALVIAGFSAAGGVESSSQAAAQVVVVKATNACFSSTIRVTGFLVPREEAQVSLDVPGGRVIEVLAAEGDRVTLGQTLVRLNRDGPEAP